MKNQRVAQIFYEIADFLEIQNVQFKPRAYRKAAMTIESMPEDIESVYKKGGLRALEELPGVGERIAEKIEEIIKTGKLRLHGRLRKEIPVKVEELMSVEGMGPKRIKLLYQKLGVKNLHDLKKVAAAGKIREIPTLGAKVEENILKGIGFAKTAGKRFLIGLIWEDIAELENKLKTLKEVEQISSAGSVRRKKETIGDLDILITSKDPEKVMNFFTALPSVKEILAKGKTKSSVRFKNNLKVDLRVLKPESFGSALQYFTGSKNHNIHLRKIAIEKGLKLSEYGLFRGRKMIAGRTEEQIYKTLGMDYIEPELREDCGEIEISMKHKLPKLISEKDILGDLHVHSKWSDGNNTIQEMTMAAMKMGYNYIAITDHVGHLKIARAMDEKKIFQQIEEIKKLNENINKNSLPKFRILTGVEVNIKDDGSPDVRNSILKELDIVVAAIHSGFKQPKEKITGRIIKAMENEHVDIIGHPTGRLLQKREPCDLDMDKIYDAAKETGTALEINAFPERLDLWGLEIKNAIQHKVKLTIGTDAHDANHLRFVKFGVFQAKRGWCEKKHILNTLVADKLLKSLK